MENRALSTKGSVCQRYCHRRSRRLIVRFALSAAFSDMDRAGLRECLSYGVQGQHRVNVPLHGRYVGESFLQGNVYVRTVEVHQSAPVEHCGPLMFGPIDRGCAHLRRLPPIGETLRSDVESVSSTAMSAMMASSRALAVS